MKLQGIGIIFVMIAFPMILILSYYVQLQIDTITLQTSYDNKLIDATYDAVAAFEINTANEDLSAVSDSLRSIINASTTTFTNTLGTSLGLSNASKERIQEYIPAILYTLYDGYYIYAPTDMPVIKEDLATDEEIRINYGIEDPDGIEISKGALYDEDGSVIFEDEDDVNGTTNSQEAEKEQAYVLKSYMPYSATYKDGADYVTINYTLDNFISVSGKVGGIYYTKSGYYIKEDLVTYCSIGPDWKNKGQDELKKICEDTSNSIDITIDGVNISTTNDANRKAITYYLTNTVFSKWVNANLGFVSEATFQNNIDDDENEELYHEFDIHNSTKIFENSYDPEGMGTRFDSHKYNIIKNAIQYNLNLAISTYNEKYVKSAEFRMPQLTDNQWEQITGKVSIVSFMQGLPCGTKTYNGYAVVSSTNNELTVIPEEIYYVKEANFGNSMDYYHRIDCPELDVSAGVISFKSKEVKYDKIYNKSDEKYKYDHRNLACYTCIIQSNYPNVDINTEPDRKKAYYIAVGKERQNLYKTTAYSKNEGIRIDNTGTTSVNITGDIIKAEVTIRITKSDGVIGEIISGSGKYVSIATRSTQTVVLENTGTHNINTTFPGSTATLVVESIKYIYK